MKKDGFQRELNFIASRGVSPTNYFGLLGYYTSYMHRTFGIPPEVLLDHLSIRHLIGLYLRYGTAIKKASKKDHSLIE
jgi:hypothetical protein